MNDYTEIIRGVRHNRPSAQMKFYDMYAAAVYRSAFAVTAHGDEAEEIMQDCILKVLSTTSLLHEDAEAMRRILCRMAVNKAIDALRRRKDFVVAAGRCEEADCEDDDGDGDTDATPGIDDIRDAIGRLPDIYRSIISLRLFEEMHFGEIACRLNINPSTVRVQYTRGISKLRTYLKEKQNDYERYA
ncbi:MAG: sigma-70 family RNA polymerase sigma factor [Tannerella sp.]|nr:sigma-70 family RNA polymerase sigma factor [Tannerella sp.]